MVEPEPDLYTGSGFGSATLAVGLWNEIKNDIYTTFLDLDQVEDRKIKSTTLI